MSYTVNKAIVLGRLGHDPELKYLPSGAAVCSISVATDHKAKDAEKPETTWHKIIIYGKSGEAIGRMATKGTQVYVEGRMHHRNYMGRGDVAKTAFEIIADRVILCAGKGEHAPLEEHTPGEDAAAKAKAIANKNIRQPSFSDMDPEDPPPSKDGFNYPKGGGAFDDLEDDVPF